MIGSHLLARALTAFAVAWATVIMVAPVALRSESLSAPSSIVYIASARICHQRPERSFAIGGSQMPVCARCSALYLAGAAGTLLAWLPGIPLGSRRVLMLAALPTAITFGLEFAGVMHFSNIARAVAALPLGAAAGWLFVGMLRYDFRLNAHKNPYR